MMREAFTGSNHWTCKNYTMILNERKYTHRKTKTKVTLNSTGSFHDVFTKYFTRDDDDVYLNKTKNENMISMHFAKKKKHTHKNEMNKFDRFSFLDLRIWFLWLESVYFVVFLCWTNKLSNVCSHWYANDTIFINIYVAAFETYIL